jgi:hypothetical protein
LQQLGLEVKTSSADQNPASTGADAVPIEILKKIEGFALGECSPGFFFAIPPTATIPAVGGYCLLGSRYVKENND